MEDVYDASTDESNSSSIDSEIEGLEVEDMEGIEVEEMGGVVDFPTHGLSISRDEADRCFACIYADPNFFSHTLHCPLNFTLSWSPARL